MHSENEVVYLYLDDIIPNRFQPREIFDERALKELAVSIKEHGIIQPIIVRSIGQKYEIIAGERRYKASALAGLTKIPAIVRNLDDKESSKVALLENLQRKNLNPIEEARTYQKILELDQMTQDQLARTMGKSQSSVANKLRLLSLSDEVQDALLKEKISERHARTLVSIKDPEEQKAMLQTILSTKMTVRDLEKEVKGEEDSGGFGMMDSIDINTVSMPTALDDLIKGNHQSDRGEQNNSMPIDFSMTPSSAPPPASVVPEPTISSTNDFMPIQAPTISDNTFVPEGGPSASENKFIPGDVPQQQEKEEKPAFINYGEIDEDDLYEDKNDFKPASLTSSNVDLDQIKSNAMDITGPSNLNLKEDGPQSGLDSLLNMTPTGTGRDESSDNRGGNSFLPPMGEGGNNPPPRAEDKSLEDLFKAPAIIPTGGISNEMPEMKKESHTSDLDALLNNGLPMVSVNEPANNNPLPSFGNNNSEGKIEEAFASIGEILKGLENNGYQVECDEMELKNSYQMVIKVNKD